MKKIFNKNINYIRSINKEAFINEEKQKRSVNIILKELAKEEFKTIESIKKITREKLGIKRDVPLYINDDIVLVILRETKDDYVYVNITNILSVIKSELFQTIIFKDNSSLKINGSIYQIEIMNKKIELINSIIK